MSVKLDDVEQVIEKIEQAIRDYHYDLDMHKHGGVAMDNAFNKICKVLEMSWERGEERKRRETEGGL